MPNFIVVIEMSYNGYGWTNEWRVVADDLAAAKTAAGSICAYHKTTHLNNVRVERAHVAASPNVTRQAFAPVPYGQFGDVVTAVDELPDPEVCVFVLLEPEAGYPGKKFFRYAVQQTEFRGAGKSSIFTSGAPQTRFDAAAASLIQALNLQSVSLGIGKSFRLANTITVEGLGHQDTDHAWFNKTNPNPISV